MPPMVGDTEAASQTSWQLLRRSSLASGLTWIAMPAALRNGLAEPVEQLTSSHWQGLGCLRETQCGRRLLRCTA